MRAIVSGGLPPRLAAVALGILLLALLPLATPPAQAAAPPGYYSTVDATNPTALRQTLHEVIDDHIRFPYTDVNTDTWDILELADEDPNDPGNILDIYKNASYPKAGGGNTNYNREHSWPKSYGFPNLTDDNYPYTDCHHLLLADAGYNTSRSNKPYRFCNAGCTEEPTLFNDGRGGGSGVYPGNSNWTTGSFTQGTWETWDGRKGDVARAILYMDIRYEGGFHGVTGFAEPDLIVTDDEALIDGSRTANNEPIGYMGMLTVLLQWHAQDPPDSREQHRNDVVFSFQGNRNPFIDHPEWVDCIYNGLCGPPDTTPPAAPTGLLASGGNSFVALDWSPNRETDLAGYNVYRSTIAGGPYSQINTALVSTNAATDTGVVNGTTYFYVVTAVDTSGNESTVSNEASATPEAIPDAIPPANPTGLAASPGDSSVDLAWAANGEPDLAGYNVYRATTTGGPYTQINTAPVTTTTTKDTGLANGTTYFYVVTAVDTSSNESGASNEASATPQAGPVLGVILSEVLYDVSGTDDGLEWVELYNAGSVAVDLSSYSLGNGGTDYTYSQVQLSGILGPGETFVVGGPTSSGLNGNPVFDLAVNFSPDFQNSGTTADGVALFDVPAAQVNASTVPIDAVIYGPTNSSNLIDETGFANPPEVGDASPDSSLERVDLAGNWRIQSIPNPNTTPLPPPGGGGGNTAPTVTITAPADGSTFIQGDLIAFSGTASDAEDGDLTATLAWSSDLDGPIGTGSGFSTTLSVGTHTLTASVTDSGGLPGSDVITVTVNAVGGTVEVTFTSVGAEDGWVRESNETSGTGGATDSGGADSQALQLGDDRRDRQLKVVVSFDTSSIPDGAAIVSATLRLRRGQVVGSNPFLTHGSARVDIATGGFSASTALESSDFEAAATAAGVSTLSNALNDLDWSEGTLDAAGLAAVHKTGTTQLRIAFDLDDDDDRGNDYMGYFSGDDASTANRPQLVVVYQP